MNFLRQKPVEKRSLNWSKLLRNLLNRETLRRENYRIPDNLVDEFDFYIEKVEKSIDEPFPELYNGLLAVIKYRYSKYWIK